MTSRTRRGLSIALGVALALGVLGPAGVPARAQGCEEGMFDSGIAWTGKSLVIVTSTLGSMGGNLYYYYEPAGSRGWHQQLVAPGNSCPASSGGWVPLTPTGYRGNSVAWTGDSVVTAAVDIRHGGLYYWWQQAGTAPWHEETVAGGPPGCCSFGSVVNGQTTPYVMSYSVPSIAWTGASVVIAATDQVGLHYWFQEKGKTAWNHQLVYQYVSAGGGAQQPSIAWTGSSVVIADLCQPGGADGLCFYWQAAGSNIWRREMVDFGSFISSPSIAWTGKSVIIGEIQEQSGIQNTVVFYFQPAGGTTWYKQTVSGPSSFNPWAAVAAAGGLVLVTAVDQGLQPAPPQPLNEWWESEPSVSPIHLPGKPPSPSSPSWKGQQPTTDYGGGTTGPRAIVSTGSSVVVDSTDACGDVDTWSQVVVKFNPPVPSVPTKQRIYTNPGWPPGTC